MSSVYSTLRIAFKAYLQGLEKSTGKDYNLEDGDIFKYAEEFEEFLAENDEFDVDAHCFSLDDTLALEIDDMGKILDNARKAFGDSEESEFFLDFADDIFASEDVIAALDTDEDGEISSEEMQGFFATVSSNDGSKDDVSMEDIFKGLEDIRKDKFKMLDSDTVAQMKEAAQVAQTAQSGGVSGTGGGGSTTGGSTRTNNTQQQQQQTPETKYESEIQQYTGLDKLDVAALEQKKTEADASMTEWTEKYTQAVSGHSENAEAARVNMEKTYDDFLAATEADEATKEQARIQREAVMTAEEACNQASVEQELVTTEITSLNVQIETLTTQITALDSSISSLQAAKSSQPATIKDENGKEVANPAIAQYEAQIQALTSQKQEIEATKQQLTEQRTQKEAQQLQIQQRIRDELVPAYTAAVEAFDATNEALIGTSEALATAFQTYTDSKTQYDTVQTEDSNKAKATLSVAATNQALVQNQLHIAKYNEGIAAAEKLGPNYVEPAAPQTPQGADNDDGSQNDNDEDDEDDDEED